MSSTSTPTERDRFWLGHETAIKASGTSAKAYPAEQGLSLHALYQARKRLRALGLITPTRAARSDRKNTSKAVSFSKIGLATPRGSQPGFRLSFPNGLVLEWSGAELPSPVVALVERLTKPR